jgi:hypothetical protein
VTTNLNTGGTFTNVFAVSNRDHTIVDNGDGTITITTIATGGLRAYDADGNFVLKDPGQTRFAVDIDYNGTPGDPPTTSRSRLVPDRALLHREQRLLGPQLLCGPGEFTT